MKVEEGAPPRLHSEAAKATGSSWQGRLQLELAQRRAGTRLVRSEHRGPLRVQRPFYPEGDSGPCHVYVLHPPGGVVTGDQLALEVTLREGAQALLTAPGATKLYSTRASQPNRSHPARVAQQFAVGPGALLEWLPHETIVYDGAHARVTTSVTLRGDATYAGWELLCLGRPAAGERFTRGELSTELSVERDGRLVFLERGLYRGGDPLLDEPWGLGGQAVYGSFVVAAPAAEPEWVERLRAELADSAPCHAATLVSGLLVLRYLGASTREARALFERAYALLRPLYAGRAVVPPRIWST